MTKHWIDGHPFWERNGGTAKAMWAEGKTFLQISKVLGTSRSAVSSFVRRHGLNRGAPVKKPEEKIVVKAIAAHVPRAEVRSSPPAPAKVSAPPSRHGAVFVDWEKVERDNHKLITFHGWRKGETVFVDNISCFVNGERRFEPWSGIAKIVDLNHTFVRFDSINGTHMMWATPAEYHKLRRLVTAADQT